MLTNDTAGTHRALFPATKTRRVSHAPLSSVDLSSVMKELPRDLRCSPCVSHALQMRTAWALGNYHVFFKLYRSTPNTGGCLVDMFVERERREAVKAMAKAYVM